VNAPSLLRRSLRCSLACLAALSLVGAAGRVAADTVTVKGSDTMVILAQRWIELYKRDRPEAVVQLTGGGSETGIAALINGTTDIAAASRPMTTGETTRAEARHGRHVAQVPVAFDALAIFVNEANPITALSLDDLRRIFRGDVTSWRELGGKDAPIAIYGRDHNSGSNAYFRHEILQDEDFGLEVLNLVGTASVVDSVAKDRNGIGYGGIAYVAGTKTLRLKARPDAPAVAATDEHVRDGSYPLSRRLWLHVAEPPDADTAAFLAWVQSDAGQGVVAQVGFYPLATQTAR
jgi:phosphate transport system substrate-binding protein